MSANRPPAEPRWEDPFRFMTDLAWVMLVLAGLALASMTPFWPWK